MCGTVQQTRKHTPIQTYAGTSTNLPYLHNCLPCTKINWGFVWIKCRCKKTAKRQSCHHAKREGKNCIQSGKKCVHFREEIESGSARQQRLPKNQTKRFRSSLCFSILNSIFSNEMSFCFNNNERILYKKILDVNIWTCKEQ